MDDTQPHAADRPADRPTDRPATSAPGAANPSEPEPAASTPPPPSSAPSAEPASGPGPGPMLRVDPDRPADSGWREPAWMPPRDRDRDRRPSTVAIVVGLVLIGLGVWFFLDRTLGYDLPRIQWSSVWPIILIVVGGLILLRSIQRRT